MDGTFKYIERENLNDSWKDSLRIFSKLQHPNYLSFFNKFDSARGICYETNNVFLTVSKPKSSIEEIELFPRQWLSLTDTLDLCDESKTNWIVNNRVYHWEKKTVKK